MSACVVRRRTGAGAGSITNAIATVASAKSGCGGSAVAAARARPLWTRSTAAKATTGLLPRQLPSPVRPLLAAPRGQRSAATSSRTTPADYHAAFRASIDSPADFWQRAAADISWIDRAGPVLRYRQHPQHPQHPQQPHDYDWFAEHTLNTCFNAVDLHILNGRAEHTALIYDSAMLGVVRKYSYGQLLHEVCRVARGLQRLGVSRGDVVLIYMPMVPEAVFAMLACARLGAVHSVVFGGFAGPELSKRIVDAQPKVILTASCGIEPHRVLPYLPMVDEALELAQYTPRKCVVLQREPTLRAALRPERDMEWTELTREDVAVAAEPQSSQASALSSAWSSLPPAFCALSERVAQLASAYTATTANYVPCVPVRGSDPLYVLYTSGTTGTPKGVQRDNAGHAVALKWSMRHVYGADEDTVWWSASDLGWAVGHSYIVYAPLLLGCTSVLFEGKPVGTPDAGTFWRVISRHRVNMLFVAPTAVRAINKEDPRAEMLATCLTPEGRASFHALWLAGERSDPDTVRTCQRNLPGVPVIDHWWQTETGWPMTANCRGMHLFPIKPGSANHPVPGYDLQVLDDDGRPLPIGSHGNLAVRLPLPPGCLGTLWRNHERFVKSYMTRFPGYYDTADAGYIDADGYVHVMARTDDVLNVAGHRLSSGRMEESLSSHPAVAESAVVAMNDDIKGHVPLGFVVLKAGVSMSQEVLEKDLIAKMRHDVGAIAAPKHVVVVRGLPKTRSGKILRVVLRAMVNHEPLRIPPTIEDERVLDAIQQALHQRRIVVPPTPPDE